MNIVCHADSLPSFVSYVGLACGSRFRLTGCFEEHGLGLRFVRRLVKQNNHTVSGLDSVNRSVR